ncbi:hypothetical protein PINS_up001540 [Pythium insidiosum]|nr:hypothetical protein PINS_up001540 [Pythium insidiosum]
MTTATTMEDERLALELQHLEDVFWMQREESEDVAMEGDSWEDVLLEATEWFLQQWRSSRLALQRTLPLVTFRMFDTATTDDTRGPVELLMATIVRRSREGCREFFARHVTSEFRTFVLVLGRTEDQTQGKGCILYYLL